MSNRKKYNPDHATLDNKPISYTTLVIVWIFISHISPGSVFTDGDFDTLGSKTFAQGGTFDDTRKFLGAEYLKDV